ncbi:MAG: cobalt-precorrin 5A hydrolase [Clostridia bacterium]|nr:cobalt-precorrin 5A hydrolase [Clostridia bacterium]
MTTEQESSPRKKAAVLSFTPRGSRLANAAADILKEDWDVLCYMPKGELKDLTAHLFATCDALIFVSACGIAVRAIAPYVASKTSDPAVVVMDEGGSNVISLLSGHIGGANELTRMLAEGLGANPVITTATDVNGKFSVDAWAARNGMAIDSMELAKLFSVRILGEDLPLYSEFPIDGELPEGVYLAYAGKLGAAITFRTIHPFVRTLRLVPKVIHLGIGCRRGTEEQAIDKVVSEVLAEMDLDPLAVADVSSIDLKADEPGLLAFCASRGWKPRFYTADELMAVEGEFSASVFVKKAVGVDNVCERSAVLSAGAGKLILHKTSQNGVTVAAALEDRRICFE